MKYTKTTLKKVEKLLKELGYTIRYEKGSFVSGYAIVEHRKIAVINRFFDPEARINALSEILSKIEVDESTLTEESLDIFYLLHVAKKESNAVEKESNTAEKELNAVKKEEEPVKDEA